MGEAVEVLAATSTGSGRQHWRKKQEQSNMRVPQQQRFSRLSHPSNRDRVEESPVMIGSLGIFSQMAPLPFVLELGIEGATGE